jgi:hypothetical protein
MSGFDIPAPASKHKKLAAVMEDFAAFCRQRLKACFHRRRKYPLGSEDREQAVKDTRDFIRYYREELDWQEIDRMAQVLEIAAPVKATAEERCQWVAWWKSSYETARTLSDEQKAYLKSGRWWPPLSASMIGLAPEIVLRTSRPGLYADEKQTNT